MVLNEVSVIIPSVRSGREIEKTLKSVPKGCEVVLIRDEKRRGAAWARNQGIKKAKRNYLLFVDDDVWFGKKVVKELLEPLKEGKDISFPQVVFEDGVVHSPRKGGNPEFPGIGACFMMTKKAVEKVGLLDETYGFGMEETDFFVRCDLAGLHGKYVKGAKVIHALKGEERFHHVMDETRFYREVKNGFYGYFKFRGKLRGIKANHCFKLRTLGYLFLLIFLNRITFLGFEYRVPEKICDSRIRLAYLYFMGLWDFLNKRFYGEIDKR